MKLLILILSYRSFPFDQFMDAQMTTWDSEKHPDIDVRYYHGMPGTDSRELFVNCPDDYNMMHWKFKLALDAIDYHQYDMIFRTNSCSYIVKDKLLEVAGKLPRTGCYAGWQNETYISGAGIFFTPDVLDILRAELTDEPHGAEDVLMGDILRGRVDMIDDRSRVDAGLTGAYGGSYHYRFKTANDLLGRIRDIENMKELHERLKV